MLFNSFEFLYFFLPLVWLGYFILQHRRLSKVARLWLLCGSLCFYSWWSIRYLPLYISSICLNYVLSRVLRKEAGSDRGRLMLSLGIAANIGLLLYYKYSDFFLREWNNVSGRDIPLLHLALPLAISFFTIQQIVYLVDTHQGVTADSSFFDYALFISFFPHLIAGPIVQHRELIPQFHEKRRYLINYSRIWRGVLMIVLGLLKKVMLADIFAIWVKQGFDSGSQLSFFSAWASSLSYTFQLYFDFSGYSDMAIGIALLFNLDMPMNFKSPYRSRNMIQFWQTWHITLSRFITDYLYTPILRSFSKITFANSMIATLLAMLIAGAWHGADWKFLLFGCMHGIGLVVNHLMKKRKWKLPTPLAWALTMFWVNLAFVFFRAKTWGDAGRVLRGMFYPQSFVLSSLQPWIMLALGFFIVLRMPTLADWLRGRRSFGIAMSFVTAALVFLAISAMEFQNANEFLYFKF